MSDTSLPGINKAGMIATTPRDSAIATCNNNNTLLASLNAVASGGKRMRGKRMRGGFQGSIVVPVSEPLYPQTLVGSQSTNGQTVTNATTIVTGQENSKYDNLAALPAPIPAGQLRGGKRGRKSRSRKSRSRKSRSRKSRKHK